MVIDEVCGAIVRGDSVKLSSFATFPRFVTRKSGSDAIPRPAKKWPISPRRVMTFKASNVLKSRVLKGHLNRKAKGKAKP